MTELIELFNKIIEYNGQTAASIMMVVLIIVYSVYLISKNYSSLIKRYLEQKLREKDKVHTKAASHRKNITPKIRKELSELAEEVNADKALLFEFSNGSYNLVGLPFLYLTATCEVIGSGIKPVAYRYQKLNTSLFAEFLEQLEEKTYFYISNLTEIKEDFPMMYNMMLESKINSALFYLVHGVEEVIGFIVIATEKDKGFTRDEGLPKMALTAQVVSSYLNFDELEKVI